MKRRNVIKTIAIGAVTPQLLLAGKARANVFKEKPLPGEGFESRWQDWPDMRWVGPEYWGNRLQDWELKDGKALCNHQGRNRTLHSLTCQLSERPESFGIQVKLSFLHDKAEAGQRAGFLVGAKGRFEDYRSAAVFGEGLEAGITSQGELFIGEQKGPAGFQPAAAYLLVLKGNPQAGSYRLQLSVADAGTGRVLAGMEVFKVNAEDLRGNVALIAHTQKEVAGRQPAVQFEDWKINGPKTDSRPGQVFGPVCFAQYTLHKGTLKLTAQLAPVEAIKGHSVSLEVRKGNAWKALGKGPVDPLSRTAQFRVEGWKEDKDLPYRIRLEIPLKSGKKDFFYEGTVAREPLSSAKVKAAVFSCNCDHGFPDSEVCVNVEKHRPHLALFLGDQFYESTGRFGIETSPVDRAALDYLRKWYMFGWSYRDIYRHIPSAMIPDDHDAYHGNLWGQGGKVAPTDQGWSYPAQDQGGFKMPPDWLNMMQRTQTSHLPDPYDPTPVQQGIGVYYTSWNYGGLSFAILEDRKFKTAPKNVLPEEAKVVNGFIQNRDFDIRKHYDIDADLLGKRQMDFLEDWSTDWKDGVEMKAVLSQTNFCTVATLPKGSIIDSIVPKLPIPEPGEYVTGDAPTVDMDSNGWPQKGRDAAVRTIRKCFAFHIAGDQHLATVVQYGVEEFGDAGFAFAGPALNNTFPRRWWPPLEDRPGQTAPGEGDPGAPAYTGNFFDGFGNRMTVRAVANPCKTGRTPEIIYDRSTGYGIVTFDKQQRQIRIECWPRYADPQKNPDAQYPGWPLTISQEDNYGRKAAAYLPELQIEGMEDPVVEVRNQDNGELQYMLRIKGRSFRPKVFGDSAYVVRVGDPDRNRWKEYAGLRPSAGGDAIKCAF